MERPIITKHAVERYKERCAKEHLTDDQAREQLHALFHVAPVVEQPEWAETITGADYWVTLSDGVVAACRRDPTHRYRPMLITIFVRGGLRREERLRRNTKRQIRSANRRYSRGLRRHSIRTGRRPRGPDVEEYDQWAASGQ